MSKFTNKEKEREEKAELPQVKVAPAVPTPTTPVKQPEVLDKYTAAQLAATQTYNKTPLPDNAITPSSYNKRGRKRQYFDPRMKALEMQKISARTKIRIQNLMDAKFDGYTPDRMIDFLYEYYLEKALSKDDKTFLEQLETASMEDWLEKPKYQKLFKELENDEKKH